MRFAEALEEIDNDDDEEQEANRMVWAMLSNAAFLAHQLLPALEQVLLRHPETRKSVQI